MIFHLKPGLDRTNMTINWLHVDFKGIMPSAPRVLDWVDRWAGLGFNGLVLEYEDRLPWQTWPGTFRPGLTLPQWRSLFDAARARGLEVIPLIQTHGHLEWLLKHQPWSGWRENECWNELCPQTPQIMPAIERWLDEVVAIHGSLRYLHIGGDETWNLATCPQCAAQAKASPDGKLGVYLRHLGRVIDLVTRRGIRPIIWADMFWREQRMDLVRRLPREVMLCDWQYAGAGPWPTVSSLGAAGHDVLGSSAIRCGFDIPQCNDVMRDRVANLDGWRRQPGKVGVLHTLWARSRSLTTLYGPWEGWWPAFLAAAEPQALAGHELHAWVPRFDAALKGAIKDAVTLADELSQARFADELADACRRWWVIALQWRELLELAAGNGRTFAMLAATHRRIGVDPHYINHRRAAHQRVLDRAAQWEQAVREFFDQRQLSDVDEFVESRLALLHAAWPEDWARDAIAFQTPRSAR
jgi:hypothetical protein